MTRGRYPCGRPALFVVVLAVAVILAPPTGAQERNARLTLGDVLQAARENNPELRAASERAKAMAAMPAQAAAWDDPTFTYELWNAPDSFRPDRADNNIFRVAQKIPFPGKRGLAGEVAKHEAERADHELRSTDIGLVAAVKRGYYELWQAHARLGVLVRDRDLVKRLTRVVEQRYATNEATQADVLRMQVEHTHLINQVQTEELAIERARAELAALVSYSVAAVSGTPEPPPRPELRASASELVQLALLHRPDLTAQEAGIAREEAAVALAKRGYLPDFEVSVGRFVNPGERDGFGAMASVTLPIFNRAKYGAAVEEARARLAMARSEERGAQDRIRREVEQAHLAARTALLQYDLFAGTHIPQAEQALRVTEGGYEAGAVPFTDMVDTLRSIQSVHLEHIAAQATFEKAYAELELAVGMELPREIRGAHHE